MGGGVTETGIPVVSWQFLSVCCVHHPVLLVCVDAGTLLFSRQLVVITLRLWLKGGVGLSWRLSRAEWVKTTPDPPGLMFQPQVGQWGL